MSSPPDHKHGTALHVPDEAWVQICARGGTPFGQACVQRGMPPPPLNTVKTSIRIRSQLRGGAMGATAQGRHPEPVSVTHTEHGGDILDEV